MAATTITIKGLTAAQIVRVRDLLMEKGMEIEDDGNDGHPDATLLYDVAAQFITEEIR